MPCSRSFASLVLLTAMLLSAGGVASAQSEVGTESPSPPASPVVPGLAEVALCEMPELGEPAGPSGRSGPLLAARSDGPVSDLPIYQGQAIPGGSRGCRAPQEPMVDPFGGPELMAYVINDFADDGPVDVLRTMWTPYQVTRQIARRAPSADGVVLYGNRNQAIPTGTAHLICTELASALEPGDSIHVATDVKDIPTLGTPSTVAAPNASLANIHDLFSFGLREDGSLWAASSDAASGTYYKGKLHFAALTRGTQGCFLIPGKGLGDWFRTLGSRSGAASDVGGLGDEPGYLATNGTFGMIDECIHQRLIHEPLVLDGVEVSFSRDEVTFCFRASDDDLDLVDALLDQVDSDVALGTITFTLREDGQDDHQERPLSIWIGDDERIYLAFPIGLKAYGYHALTTVEITPSGDPALDSLLNSAATIISFRLNPVTFDATAGDLQGAPCLPPA